MPTTPQEEIEGPRREPMKAIFNFFEKPKDPLPLQRDPHLAGVAGQDPRVVLRRGQEARDHQLPDLQAGARRPLLRQDLRTDEGLRVQLRQVQAHEAPRRRLREVRRRGHPVQGPSRAPGPHQPRVRRSHIWFLKSLPSRIGNLLDITPARPREGALLRAYVVVDPGDTGARKSARSSARSATQAARGSTADDASRSAWAPRRSDELLERSTSTTLAELRERDAPRPRRGQAQEDRQAPQGRRGLPRAATAPSG
jgi:hypothetical protein